MIKTALAIFLAISSPAWAGEAFTDENGGRATRKWERLCQATVVRVLDGDSLVVKANRKVLNIRLYGIDAPEWGQEGGDEAKAALKPIRGRTVTVREVDVDGYGRTVALIEHEGRVVNLWLVEQGWAWYYARYCRRQPICGQIQAAEAEARAAKRGIWAGRPVAPWRWRR